MELYFVVFYPFNNLIMDVKLCLTGDSHNKKAMGKAISISQIKKIQFLDVLWTKFGN